MKRKKRHENMMKSMLLGSYRREILLPTRHAGTQHVIVNLED